MKKSLLMGLAYGFVHFSVEVVSFYVVYSTFGGSRLWWVAALLYDALAFVPQNIFGAVSDKYPKLNIGMIGCFLMIISLIVRGGYAGLFLVAIGNALVHIAGAQHTLRIPEKKITPNAIFVGTGSFGVITGQLLGKSDLKEAWLISVLLMITAAFVICVVQKKNSLENKIAHVKINSEKSAALITLCSFVGVSIRGYVAYAIPTEWNKSVEQTVLLFVFMGLGKIIGGILADIIGFRRTVYISLLGALPLLLAGNTNMVLSLIGVAFFSMTMPITIAVLTSVYPKQTGIAFGITTLGLFVGTLPAFFVVPETLIQQQTVVVILTFAALFFMNICIKKEKKHESLFT